MKEELTDSVSVSTDGTTMGHLKVKNLFGTWKKFYFVLNDGILYRFKSSREYNGSASAREEIHLDADFVQVLSGRGLSGKSNTVAILRKGAHPLILMAKNEEQANTWLRMLRKNTGKDDADSSGGGSSSSSKQQLNLDDTIRMLEAITDAAVVTDGIGTVIGFNAAAEKLYGWRRSDILGQNVKLLMPDSYARYHDKYMSKYADTKERTVVGIPRALLGKRKDGSTIPVVLSLGEVDLGPGAPRYFVGCFRENSSDGSSSTTASPVTRLVTADSSSSLPVDNTSPTRVQDPDTLFNTPLTSQRSVDSIKDYSLSQSRLSAAAAVNGPPPPAKDSAALFPQSTGHAFAKRLSSSKSLYNMSQNLGLIGSAATPSADAASIPPPASAPSAQAVPLAKRDRKRTFFATRRRSTQDLKGQPIPDDHDDLLSDKANEDVLEEIRVLPPPTDLGDQLSTGQIKLIGQLHDFGALFNTVIRNEFENFMQQYNRMQKTIEVLESENSRLRDESEKRTVRINALQQAIKERLQGDQRSACLSLLSNDTTFKFFADFCRTQMSAPMEQLALFWRDVAIFKRKFRETGSSRADLQREAEAIINRYMVPNAPMELNMISRELREFVAGKTSDPTVTMFDVVADDCLTLLHERAFVAFSNTGLGKACLSTINKQNEEGSAIAGPATK